ncbi:hypothetical protein XPA_009348 [Xanthoria parietina]
MESNADIDISLFPEQAVSEDSDGSIRAQTDRSLPYSIISTGMLERLGIVEYPPCQKAAVTHRNVQHFPIGKVTLRWHKEESAKSYSEAFFVVDKHTALVILGATAFPNSGQSSGGNMYPIGVAAQTAEEKLAMNQKKLQAAQRREQEKKEQEEKEAELRREATQKK